MTVFARIGIIAAVFLVFVGLFPGSLHAAPLTFTVNMSETVAVDTSGGTPRIALDIGGVTQYADYDSGSGTPSLTFSYAVQPGDFDANGIAALSPIDLNGGTIADAVGNPADLTFVPPDMSGVRIQTYTAAWITDPITAANASNAAFSIAKAPIGASFDYTITSDGGAGSVTGSGIISAAPHTVTGVNVSSLANGTLTLSVVLSTPAGGSGTARTAITDMTVPSAAGGTETVIQQDGKHYRVHTFLSSGTLDVTRGGDFEYLIVAGGGGGGGNPGNSASAPGGGGAGGLLTGTLVLNQQAHIIVVGGGGEGRIGTGPGFNGQNSVAFSLTALGGGGGGQATVADPSGATGGSGGGGGSAAGGSTGGAAQQPDSASGGLGNAGGNSSALSGGGGGGGASAAGQNGNPTNGGDGGEGILSSISGTPTQYAGGGGGGGANAASPGSGAFGGGNGGVRGGASAGHGAINSGSGGGGGAANHPHGPSPGGNGGSGIVIVRYQITQAEYEASIP